MPCLTLVSRRTKLFENQTLLKIFLVALCGSNLLFVQVLVLVSDIGFNFDPCALDVFI